MNTKNILLYTISCLLFLNSGLSFADTNILPSIKRITCFGDQENSSFKISTKHVRSSKGEPLVLEVQTGVGPIFSILTEVKVDSARSYKNETLSDVYWVSEGHITIWSTAIESDHRFEPPHFRFYIAKSNQAVSYQAQWPNSGYNENDNKRAIGNCKIEYLSNI